MKTKTIQWGERTYQTYKPRINRKRQATLGSLVLADVILPATFGLGIIVSKVILKLNPLFLYK